MPSTSPNEGRQRGYLQTTQWTLVSAARSAQPVEAAKALEELCRIYWTAVYAYIRNRGYAGPDAADVTQGFFVHLLSGNFLRYIDPQIGRFRVYLLRCVQNYLNNEWHRETAQKRRGDALFVSWDQIPESVRASCEPTTNETPEKAFERQWVMSLIRTAFNRLTDEIQRCSTAPRLLPLRRCLVDEEERTYQELAKSLGMSPAGVKAAVHRLRVVFRRFLREEIAKTVKLAEPLEHEIQDLLHRL